jgi:acyl carrier protein
MSRVSMTRSEVRAKVLAIVAECAEIPVNRLADQESLHRHGVDSLAGVNIAYEIGLLIGRDVPSELVTEHDTVEKLVEYVLCS